MGRACALQIRPVQIDLRVVWHVTPLCHTVCPVSYLASETGVVGLDCQQCGACCFSETDRFVRVMGKDYAQLGETAEELVHFIEHRAFMRMEDGHCAALHVDPRTGRFTCQVYAVRPDACRELANGSPACRGERHMKEPLVLVNLRIARGRG